MRSSIFLLLGSNLGNKLFYLKQACIAIDEEIGKVLQSSKIYETDAWGIEDQPSFLNQVIEVSSSLTPHQILEKINTLERTIGRIRHGKWGSRVIDIDILYDGSESIQSKDLTIPHPQIQNRRFTLVPLCELDPNFIHPILKRSNQDLLDTCKDSLEVRIF